ncbi:MAG TPA: SulP family inorganic anion transporter [Burkholderiaceae bacterium]|nr:SulP family inorganic anion transporter [Burkholderiaceae bacterium]
MLKSQFQPFRPRLLDAIKGYDRHRFIADLGAGVTVGVVALPLAMAFAIASGVKPEQGIITAIVAGFLIAVLGGSNVQIGGPAGAFIVIDNGIVERYGLTNLLIATALAGAVLFAMGLLKLGTLVRYVPVQIIIGFTNGIAVLIALSQLKDLFGLQAPKASADFFSQTALVVQHFGTFNPYAFAIGLVSFGGLMLWPKLFIAGTPLPGSMVQGPLGRFAARVPGPVVALVTMTAIAAWLKLPVETIGTRFGGIPQTLPALELPAFSWDSAKQLLIPTLTIAMLGAVESLLCARVADQLATLPKHDPNQELMAQGIANIIAPVFGGIPATGTIARTVTNVRAGATTPIAGVVHAVALLAVVLVAAPLAASVPLAALAGILLFVAWNMGEWHEFSRERLRRFTFGYRTVLLGTFFLTVVFDLMVAVQMGLVAACVIFIWRMSLLFRAEPASTCAQPSGVEVVRLNGALFFGAVGKIETLADGLPATTRALVLEMHRLIWIDASGVDALTQLYRRLQRTGIELWLCELKDEPLEMVRRTGFADLLGHERLAESLDAAVKAAALATAQPVKRAA